VFSPTDTECREASTSVNIVVGQNKKRELARKEAELLAKKQQVQVAAKREVALPVPATVITHAKELKPVQHGLKFDGKLPSLRTGRPALTTPPLLRSSLLATRSPLLATRFPP
jgi:hypothetical protein